MSIKTAQIIQFKNRKMHRPISAPMELNISINPDGHIEVDVEVNGVYTKLQKNGFWRVFVCDIVWQDGFDRPNDGGLKFALTPDGEYQAVSIDRRGNNTHFRATGEWQLLRARVLKERSLTVEEMEKYLYNVDNKIEMRM